MTADEALLAAYDAQLQMWVPANPPPGYEYQRRGAVLRVVGQPRGFIDTARMVGAEGAAWTP